MNDGLIGAGVPVDVYDLLLFDLDGVVYIGPAPVPQAPEAIARAQKAGVRCTFVTNNASRRPGVVADHLREFGIDCADDDVVTSAQGAAAMLARRLPAGAPVLVIGGDGLTWALGEAGLTPVTSLDDDPQAVVQGFGPDVGWRQLAEGAIGVSQGLPFIATNLDLTVPTPRGRAPGNGALVGTVVAATGVQPEVAGKPQPTLFLEAVARYGGRAPLVIGDRLDTDLEGARAAGLDGLMVLTGVHRTRELLAAAPGVRPHLIARDLRGLETVHPAPEPDDDGWRVGSAVVGPGLEVRNAGDDALDVLRAACAAAWAGSEVGTGTVDPTSLLAVLHRMEPDGPWGT
ncbi:HAD-IIA family hydrolase [Spongisporangium articulatum]|uniref:HAD-IIA family hydrolase n=1 Tax=Spongisporangium articulatum TaxID=3362603 RepID=A0ABW8ASL2_9ACTN